MNKLIKELNQLEESAVSMRNEDKWIGPTRDENGNLDCHTIIAREINRISREMADVMKKEIEIEKAVSKLREQLFTIKLERL